MGKVRVVVQVVMVVGCCCVRLRLRGWRRVMKGGRVERVVVWRLRLLRSCATRKAAPLKGLCGLGTPTLLAAQQPLGSDELRCRRSRREGVSLAHPPPRVVAREVAKEDVCHVAAEALDPSSAGAACSVLQPSPLLV